MTPDDEDATVLRPGLPARDVVPDDATVVRGPAAGAPVTDTDATVLRPAAPGAARPGGAAGPGAAEPEGQPVLDDDATVVRGDGTVRDASWTSRGASPLPVREPPVSPSGRQAYVPGDPTTTPERYEPRAGPEPAVAVHHDLGRASARRTEAPAVRRRRRGRGRGWTVVAAATLVVVVGLLVAIGFASGVL